MVIKAEARVDVPSSIARIVGMRKSNGKCPHAHARPPSPFPNELIKCVVKQGGVRRRDEWLRGVVAEPNNGLSPSRWIVGRAMRVLPKNGARSLRDVPREGVIDPQESARLKLVDVELLDIELHVSPRTTESTTIPSSQPCASVYWGLALT